MPVSSTALLRRTKLVCLFVATHEKLLAVVLFLLVAADSMMFSSITFEWEAYLSSHLTHVDIYLCLEMNKRLAVLGTDGELESNIFKKALLKKDMSDKVYLQRREETLPQ